MRDIQEELSKMSSVAQEKTSMVERLQQQLSQEQQRTAQLESGTRFFMGRVSRTGFPNRF